eukprot:g863.t1
MGNTQTTSSIPTTKSSQASATKHINFGHVDYAVLESYLRNVRSDRVRNEFFTTPEESYTKKDEIRVWVSTFNLNGRKPPENLDFGDFVKKWESHWPQREKVGTGSHRKPDLYIMGFQEAVPLTAQNIIAGWTNIPAGWDRSIDRSLNKWKTEEELVNSPFSRQQREEQIVDSYLSQWTGAPSANLQIKSNNKGAKQCQKNSQSDSLDKGPRVSAQATTADLISFDEAPVDTVASGSTQGKQNPLTKVPGKLRTKTKDSKDEAEEEFVQILSHQLVGLYISGWARKSLIKRITGIQITTVATGALGYLANKGAIAARMRIDDSAFVFITSHLASGSHEGDQLKRNLDYKEIIRRMQFPREISLVKVTKEDGTTVEDFSSRPDGLPLHPSSEVKRAFVGGNWSGFRTLRDLDNIIWVGDLNYRINGTPKEVIKFIRDDKLNALLEVDELSVEKAAGNVFQGFTESPIDFPPTYKFIRGTNYYTGEIEETSSESSDTEERSEREDAGIDPIHSLESHPVQSSLRENSFHADHVSFNSTRHPELLRTMDRLGISVRGMPITESETSAQLNSPSVLSRRGSAGDLPMENLNDIEVKKEESKKKRTVKKIRTPAWTDRILFYSSKRVLHQLLYGCFSSLLVSDHRPVVGAFLFETKKFNEEAVDLALQEARRVIDLQEMAAIPRCSLSPTYIEIGAVSYRRSKEFTVSIDNIGEVPATYSFIPAAPGRQSTRSPFPTWLSATPTSGLIKPGKKEQLKIRVSIEGGQWGSADELFGNPTNTLDHILVLHIEGGSDFFISIIGSFSLSCFGLSLNNLAKHIPVDKTRLDKMKYMKPMDLPSLKFKPKEKTNADWPMMSVDSVDSSFDPTSTHMMSISQKKLTASNSLSRTGPQPNLVEGPTGLMIPSHVLRMLHFLAGEGRLKTPNLFIESWNRVKNSVQRGAELESIVAIREALDQGEDFPSGVTAHDMAGALLTFFYDLPSPMIPESLTQTCEASDVSCMLATSLVEEAMSAIEWSVFDTTMELMRSALLEENTKANQLTIHTLAEIISEAFFQHLNKPIKQGSDHKDEIEELTPRVKVLQERRCKFIENLLGADNPIIDLPSTRQSSDQIHGFT